MQININLLVDVSPGAMKTAEEIKADVLNGLDNDALMLGFHYGATDYTVNSVTPD